MKMQLVSDDKMGRIFRWCLLPVWGIAAVVALVVLGVLIGAMLLAAFPVTILLYGTLQVVKLTAPKVIADEMPNIFP